MMVVQPPRNNKQKRNTFVNWYKKNVSKAKFPDSAQTIEEMMDICKSMNDPIHIDFNDDFNNNSCDNTGNKKPIPTPSPVVDPNTDRPMKNNVGPNLFRNPLINTRQQQQHKNRSNIKNPVNRKKPSPNNRQTPSLYRNPLGGKPQIKTQMQTQTIPNRELQPQQQPQQQQQMQIPPEIAAMRESVKMQVRKKNQNYTDANIEYFRLIDFELSEVPIIAVLDTFSYNCFKHECKLHKLDKDGFKEQYEKVKPKLFLCESGWESNVHGIRMPNIRRKNESYADDRVKDWEYMRTLVDFYRSKQVPCVFWNKEDGVHYDKFIDFAKLFDYIFTTDENVVAKYRNETNLPINNISVLPFAAQTKIHNPLNSYKQKQCYFAGSWYSCYPERCDKLRRLIDLPDKYELDIYDRNYGKNYENFTFPEKYNARIKGTLSYEELNEKSKMYKFMLNVNTVENSPTMFSRRVFEAIASRVCVISTESVGVKKILGNYVRMTDSLPETMRTIDYYERNPEIYKKHVHKGYAFIHKNHTYEHRLRTVFNKVFELAFNPSKPITIFMIIKDEVTDDKFRELYNRFDKQTYDNKRMVIFVDDQYELDRTRTLIKNNISNRNVTADLTKYMATHCSISDKGYVALFLEDCKYAPEYLADGVLPFKYTTADIVGKSLLNEHIYDNLKNLRVGSLIMRKSKTAKTVLSELAKNNLEFITGYDGCYAADRYAFTSDE